MVKKVESKGESIEALLAQTNDLLKKQLILQLALQGVPKQSIRKVVGVGMNYVTDVLRPLKGKVDVQ